MLFLQSNELKTRKNISTSNIFCIFSYRLHKCISYCVPLMFINVLQAQQSSKLSIYIYVLNAKYLHLWNDNCLLLSHITPVNNSRAYLIVPLICENSVHLDNNFQRDVKDVFHKIVILHSRDWFIVHNRPHMSKKNSIRKLLIVR